jgi:hypothetical protein
MSCSKVFACKSEQESLKYTSTLLLSTNSLLNPLKPKNVSESKLNINITNARLLIPGTELGLFRLVFITELSDIISEIAQ